MWLLPVMLAIDDRLTEANIFTQTLADVVVATYCMLVRDAVCVLQKNSRNER